MRLYALSRSPCGRVPRVIAGALALLVGGAAALSAQGHLVRTGDDVLTGAATVSPRNGAPGTIIKVAPHGLPPNTLVQIMLGELDAWEVLQTLATDDRGRIAGLDTVSLTVPDWVKNDRAYLVMLTTPEYRPLVAADMFHPTDQNGNVRRKGTVKLDDPSCPMLTAELDEIYLLVGDTSALRGGERVVVEGPIVAPGRCGKVTTIDVRKSRAVP
jgi:hypothetical protein